MKILYLSTPFFADCDFPLVKAMQEAGYDVTYLIMLTPYSLKSTLFDIKEQIPKNGIFPATCYKELENYKGYMDMSKVFISNRIVKQDSRIESLCMTLQIARFIKRGKYDVVHTDCMLGMWDIMLYKLFGNKMVLTVHDPFPHTGEVTARKMFNYKVAMRSVQHFVLLNNKQVSKFCETYKLSLGQILVNRLGVYDNIQAFVRQSEDKVEHKKNVLFFGRISPYKGVEYLCKAMEKVHEQVPDATLTIAGGGMMYFDIEQYRRYDWVDIRNHYVDMGELAELLQQCSISVCPYTDATQSGVIMTSYGMCRPVVASDVGGLGEMIEDGKTGLLVPPKDVDALACAIISLLKDDDKCRQMQNYIKKEYLEGEKSWAAILEKYVEFYDSIK